MNSMEEETLSNQDQDSLCHYGMPRRSGRYPWGSGDDSYQRGRDFIGRVEELRKQNPTYVDDKGNLFLRLSKEDAVDEKITIVDSGDSIHLKVKIAAYPAKKEIAIKKVREAIENN